MNNVQLLGIFLNLIIYFIIILPIIIISLNKKIYNNKKYFCLTLILSFLIEIILSIIIYVFSKSIFSLFSSIPGIVNYAVYSSKILFITSSLYGLKILIPAYLFNKKMKKKSAILFLLKIAVNMILIFIGYNLFNTKGILYSFPICDLIFYILYITIFLNIIRNDFQICV